jgi:hypothetical protein
MEERASERLPLKYIFWLDVARFTESPPVAVAPADVPVVAVCFASSACKFCVKSAAAMVSIGLPFAPITTATFAIPPATKGAGYAAALAMPIVEPSITALANTEATFLKLNFISLTSFHLYYYWPKPNTFLGIIGNCQAKILLDINHCNPYFRTLFTGQCTLRANFCTFKKLSLSYRLGRLKTAEKSPRIRTFFINIMLLLSYHYKFKAEISLLYAKSKILGKKYHRCRNTYIDTLNI